MDDTTTVEVTDPRTAVLAARVEAGMAWLTTEGIALGLDLSRLCDNLNSLVMTSTSSCVLGLSAPVGKDFHWAHKHLCYEGIGVDALLLDEPEDRRARFFALEEQHDRTSNCKAVAYGFDLDPYAPNRDWDTLAHLWTATLTPWCAEQEDHR